MTDETSHPFAEEDDNDNIGMSCGIWMTNYCSDLRDIAQYFSDFLALDTDLATGSANTEEEAAKKALIAAQLQPASAAAGVTDDSPDDDVEEICTIQEATENVWALRHFLRRTRLYMCSVLVQWKMHF